MSATTPIAPAVLSLVSANKAEAITQIEQLVTKRLDALEAALNKRVDAIIEALVDLRAVSGMTTVPTTVTKRALVTAAAKKTGAAAAASPMNQKFATAPAYFKALMVHDAEERAKHLTPERVAAAAGDKSVVDKKAALDKAPASSEAAAAYHQALAAAVYKTFGDQEKKNWKAMNEAHTARLAQGQPVDALQAGETDADEAALDAE
jgi:hypothetical protein